MNSQLVDTPAVSIPSVWKWAVSVGMVTFALQLWLCYPLIYDYFPNSDDIALEASSTAIGGPIDPALWLTEGFHSLFHPYPEWGSLPTNFWRPMANALFWIHYQIFGTQWGSQLVLGYFLHALIVSMTAYISLA